jgi:hypothetical protein
VVAWLEVHAQFVSSPDSIGALRPSLRNRHMQQMAPTPPLGFGNMRDRETIDSELRLLAAVRRMCREQDGVLPSIGPVDELLDERRELDRKLTGG